MFKIFHQFNCESSYLICLIQCQVSQLQDTGKSETSFNMTLNNHRKDSKNENAILTCKYFQNLNHMLQQNAKFTLTEQIKKNVCNYKIVMATPEKTGKLLDSKTESTLPRWFEPRT